jgi:hypothetical protein
MHRSLKRKLVLVLAALAAVAFAGGAYAAATTSTTNVRQAFLNDVAHRLNVTPAQLRAAIRGAYLDQLNAAVASGRLTRAQAAELRKWAQSAGVVPFGALLGPRARFALPALPLRAFKGAGPAPLGRPPRFFAPAPLRFLAPAGGPRAVPLPFAAAPFKQAILFGGLLSSARYLGITPMQLLKQLRAGKSLAQIATAQGKSAAGLKTALVARARQMIGRLVAAKVITAARGQRLLARLSARLDKLINRTNLRFFPFIAPVRSGIPQPVPVP